MIIVIKSTLRADRVINTGERAFAKKVAKEIIKDQIAPVDKITDIAIERVRRYGNKYLVSLKVSLCREIEINTGDVNEAIRAFIDNFQAIKGYYELEDVEEEDRDRLTIEDIAIKGEFNAPYFTIRALNERQ